MVDRVTAGTVVKRVHTYILLCNVATPMDPQKVTSYLAVSENELSFFIFLISIHKNDDDDQNAK